MGSAGCLALGGFWILDGFWGWLFGDGAVSESTRVRPEFEAVKDQDFRGEDSGDLCAYWDRCRICQVQDPTADPAEVRENVGFRARSVEKSSAHSD